MKIKTVKYKDGEARFIIEEHPKQTFCIKLNKQKSKEEIKEELKNMIPEPDISEDLFDTLKLKELEGTDL